MGHWLIVEKRQCVWVLIKKPVGAQVVVGTGGITVIKRSRWTKVDALVEPTGVLWDGGTGWITDMKNVSGPVCGCG